MRIQAYLTAAAINLKRLASTLFALWGYIAFFAALTRAKKSLCSSRFRRWSQIKLRSYRPA
jgi:hypothetical protein